MKKSNSLLLRAISLCTAIMLTLPALAGCGGNSSALPAKAKLTNVYKSQNIPIEISVDNINAVAKTDSGYLAVGTTYENIPVKEAAGDIAETTAGDVAADAPAIDVSEPAAESTYQQLLKIITIPNEGEQSAVSVKYPDSNSYVNNCYIGSDNTIWYSMTSNITNEDGTSNTKVTIYNITTAGEAISSFDAIASTGAGGENFYGFNSFVLGLNGDIYLATQNTVYTLSAAGELKYKNEVSSDYINYIIPYDGGVYVLYYDNQSGKQDLISINSATGVSDSNVSIDPTVMANLYSLYPGSDGKFYYSTSSGIWSYDITANKNSEMLNYINSDLGDTNLNSVSIIDENTILATSNDYSGDKVKTTLMLLTAVPDEEQTEKYIITLACSYLDYNIKKAVIAFNRANDEYRISIKDYSSYNTDADYTAGLTMLNNDIIAGNIPDILLANTQMPVDSYISKGMFADLNTYFEKDTEINRSDYLENIFNAFEVDGKLYSLIPSFYFISMACKSSVANGSAGLTMDEFNAILAAHPDEVPLGDVTRDNLLEYICSIAIEDYINRDDGTCTFNSDGFKKALTFAKSLDTKSIYDSIDWNEVDDDFWTNLETAIRDDRQLFQIQYVTAFADYWYSKMSTFGGDMSLVGLPSDTRNGNAIFANIQLLMSSKTPLSDGIWSFFKYLLSDEYQKTQYNFPVKQSTLEEKIKEAQTPTTYTDENGNTVEQPNYAWIANQQIDIGFIDEDTVNYLLGVIKGLDKVAGNDQKVIEIIKEEASSYFGDQKTVDEVADIIQNRVSIYISENR